MTKLEAGRAWSDERHKVRQELRGAIDRIVEADRPDTLTTEDVVELILEAAVGHYAWGGKPDDVARCIERLARRVRYGEQFEF